MASLFQKLLKNPQRHIGKLTPSRIPQPNQISTENPLIRDCPIPLFSPGITQDTGFERTQLFNPSFPFGYSLNPVSSTGFDPSGSDDADDANKIWADSVKKKRKKKMNKHKYQKLRKRLRRKT